MITTLKARIAALTASVALLGGAAFIASGTTGAYFSDTKSGTISGSIGSIKITPYGGSGDAKMNLAFTNMLPGEPQTVTIRYRNTGTVTQDVWIVFNNATALSALNSLGSYGEADLKANGTTLFDSANLNDRGPTCGAFVETGCWPLLSQYRVAQNVAPGGTGWVSFSFNYASKLTAAGPAWNVYPVSTQQWDPAIAANPDHSTTVWKENNNRQYTVNASDGSGSGLPYQLVATQRGIAPGQ